MAHPDRDGEFVGETVLHDHEVWMWMGREWELAHRVEPDSKPAFGDDQDQE